MREKSKMIAGKMYDPADPQLVLERARANRICTKYNLIAHQTDAGINDGIALSRAAVIARLGDT